MELKKFMEVKKYLKKLTGKKEQPVPSGIENIVLAAAHQYFMQLPHSYFLRKGPK